jgi:uncharacterized membrane protein YraQ (UPF0718 family)
MAVTWALIDPVMTVARPVAAFFSAFLTGIMENLLAPQGQMHGTGDATEPDRSCQVDSCCDGKGCPPEEHSRHHSFLEKVVAGLKFAVTDVWADLAGWFLMGLLIAGVIAAILPGELFASHLGGGVGSMLLMLAVGIPIYICATASTPVAAALIMKGASPGTALVFLLAGPATNVTSLSVITGILGKRGTAVYLLCLSACAVISGLVLDAVYMSFGISATAAIGQASGGLPHWLKVAGAIIILALSVRPVSEKLKKLFAGKGRKVDGKEDRTCCSGGTCQGKEPSE